MSGSRFFYGYIVVIASFFIFFAAFGIRLSYGVFFMPMSTELGWSNSTTALAYSISAIIEGIFNIIFGGLTDKYGPRIVTTICGVLIGAGYCLMPFVHSIWQFYLFYGLILGVGMGGIFAPLIAVITRWFKTRRSVMSGLVISGNGLGLLVVSPLATQLIIREGWRSAFLIIGISVLIIIVVAAQFLKRDPSLLGLLPDGRPSTSAQAETPVVSGLSFRQTLKSYQTWLCFFMFFTMGFYLVGNQIYLVPDAVNAGMSVTNAALILSTFGVMNVVGNFGLGVVADKIGNKRIFFFGFMVLMLSSLFIVAGNFLASFFIFAIIAGLANGGMTTSMAPLVASLFGLKSIGVIAGLCGFGNTLGQAAGPYVIGNILDRTHNFQAALSICIIVAFAGLILLINLKPVKNALHESARL